MFAISNIFIYFSVFNNLLFFYLMFIISTSIERIRRCYFTTNYPLHEHHTKFFKLTWFQTDKTNILSRIFFHLQTCVLLGLQDYLLTVLTFDFATTCTLDLLGSSNSQIKNSTKLISPKNRKF